VRKGNLAYLLIAAFGVIVSVSITANSFWFDESFTSFIIGYDYPEVIQRTSRDVHPPLYYLVLKLWSSLIGSTDLPLRFLSVLCISGAALAVVRFAKNIANTRWVALMTLFMVTGPFTVRYAQEARMYALAAFFTALATLVLYTTLRISRKQRPLSNYLIYGGLITASLYTHYFTFPIIFAHWLYVILIDTNYVFNLRSNWCKQLKTLIGSFDRGWLKANAFAAILFIGWLPIFVSQSLRVSSGFWIPPVDYKTIPSSMIELLTFKGINSYDFIEPRVLAVIVGLFIVGFIWLFVKVDRREKANLVLLLGPVLISITLLFVVSAMPKLSSVFHVRYLASLSVLFYAGLGYSVYLLSKKIAKPAAYVVGVGLLALMVYGSVTVLDGYGRDWNKSIQGIERLHQELQPGDALLAQTYWHFYDARHYLDDEINLQTKIEGNFFGGDTLLVGRDDIILDNYSQIDSSSGVVWFIGDSKDESFSEIPGNWKQFETIYNESNFRVTRFKIN